MIPGLVLAAAPPLATHKTNTAAASSWGFHQRRAMLPWLTRFESVGWVDSAQANALGLSGRGTGGLVVHAVQRNSMGNCIRIHFGIVGVGA
jgi:hypothetical protein